MAVKCQQNIRQLSRTTGGHLISEARRCLLCIKVELAGLTEEVGSVQMRGPRPGVRGGGSRHHSSGEVGSKKSNTSQLR